MLVLSRREDESIEILCPDGTVIEVMCIRIGTGDYGGERKVRLGVTAPKDYAIHRSEIARAIRTANDAAAAPVLPSRLVPVVGGIDAGPTLRR